MYLRACALILVLVLSAGLALQFFVSRHVEGVAVAHARDKARHTTDMLESLPSLELLFSGDGVPGAVLQQIEQMAHDDDIIETVFYDASGAHQPIDLGALDPGVHTGHQNHDVGHSMPSELLSEEGGDHAGHGVDHSKHLAALVALQDVPPRVEIDLSQEGALTDYSTLFDASGAKHQLVTALLPVRNREGQPLGSVRFKVNVDQITSAYSTGLSWFALLLVGFGAAIFGVPVLGFLLQKRIADQSNKSAKYLASFDALTGLLNRRGFISRAEIGIADKTISHIAYMDADQFKAINDTYGHATGDAYLRFIAKTVQGLFEGPSLVSRLGGDEFVVTVFNLEQTEFQRILEELRIACSQEIDLNGVTIRSSVSIGIAPYVKGHTLDQVLTDADMALYFAKAEGGNCISIYNPKMGIEMEHRRALEARLRQAVETHDFSIHYQPLIDAKTLDVFGYEALLRLSDSEGFLISPEDFIPLAEEMGLIEKIGTWVINTATRQIAEMDNNVVVAINLSTEQFKSGKLVEIVRNALANANLPPSRLELEITESLLMDNSTDVAMQIDTLKEMGVSVAMDDFGTGFSSLSYLWKFGFDRIKIDRSFIQALEEDPDRSLGLIESIILLGEKLGMRITAEGIETQNQSEILSSLGCDVLQGFYYGRPEPLESQSENYPDDRPQQQSG